MCIRDSAYSVVHQFFGQSAAGHSRISDGKIESVRNRVAQVVVIYQVETVTEEDFLDVYKRQVKRPSMNQQLQRYHLVADYRSQD